MNKITPCLLTFYRNIFAIFHCSSELFKKGLSRNLVLRCTERSKNNTLESKFNPFSSIGGNLISIHPPVESDGIEVLPGGTHKIGKVDGVFVVPVEVPVARLFVEGGSYIHVIHVIRQILHIVPFTHHAAGPVLTPTVQEHVV